jgi:hypothetical protein
LKIYCDTSALPENIRGDAKQKELSAVRELQELGIGAMFGSRIVRFEVMNTKGESRRNHLFAEQAKLNPIPNDEKPLGSQMTPDQYGGFVSSPLVSDVHQSSPRVAPSTVSQS